MKIKLFTIGFTRRTASDFFQSLKAAGVRKVVDVRLNNRSQLAGFAKREDLAYFLNEIGGIQYVHLPELAPTEEMLQAYRREKGGWRWYETQFLELMRLRKIERTLSPELFHNACLLCSERELHHCHRRLVAEYLAGKWEGLVTEHLV